MKCLQLNPQEHEIELAANSTDHGCGHISFKLGDGAGDVYLRPSEARKIGKWFLKLAEEVEKREKA
jgi:hypothetical protein